MLLRTERGKGGRYRNAMLPEGLLLPLRDWWRAGRQQGILIPDGWLFPGQSAATPISARQLHRIVVEAAEAADINKRVGPHTLRHSFATHLLSGARFRGLNRNSPLSDMSALRLRPSAPGHIQNRVPHSSAHAPRGSGTADFPTPVASEL
jgi:Site-specific recombinase XerD